MDRQVIKIDAAHARNIVLRAQGLIRPAGTPSDSTLAIIEQLGYLQIDTLSVAERSHHHVCFTRDPAYRQVELDRLLSIDKKIFEYWSHAAAFLPIKDFRFSLFRKHRLASGLEKQWFRSEKKVLRYVMDRIKAEGPLQSKDFEGQSQGTWSWKPAKRALEQLYGEGKLMIAERQGFQKVFDLTERVLPAGVDTRLPDDREMCRHLVTGGLRAQGLLKAHEMAYLRSGLKGMLPEVLAEMTDAGEVITVRVGDELYYSTEDHLAAINDHPPETALFIFSPFDNLLIQRKRLAALFDYDFQLECYLPESKRRFGYFCLPVWYHDRFIARFDPKADRKTGIFHLKKLWLENFQPDEDFIRDFRRVLAQFAGFCGCKRVSCDAVHPVKGNAILKKELSFRLS